MVGESGSWEVIEIFLYAKSVGINMEINKINSLIIDPEDFDLKRVLLFQKVLDEGPVRIIQYMKKMK